MRLTAAIGLVATILTILCFLPEVHHTYIHGGRHLSLTMYILLTVASVLWVWYGVRMTAPMVIYTNIILTILCGYITLQILRAGTQTRHHTPQHKMRRR